MDETLALDIKHLSLDLRHTNKHLSILDDLSLNLKPGKTLGLVGESGSGKSFTALSILRLLPLHACYGAKSQILVKGQDILNLEYYRMREIRGKTVSMIFQEPALALNPLRTMYQHLADVIQAHQTISRHELECLMMQLMDDVELGDMKSHLQDYPHQWSGGQKQRFLIAMALANRPAVILADEPTTALDVVIQAQILRLMKKVQLKHDLAMLIISHDLSVIRQLADEVVVMYAGQFIEHATSSSFWHQPLHPYVHQLISSLPHFRKRGENLAVISGQVPNFNEIPQGCRFHPRCAFSMDLCKTQDPSWYQKNQDQGVSCHLYPRTEALEFKSKDPKLSFKSQPKSKLLLKVDDLWVENDNKTRDKTYILQAIDFEVFQGRMLAIVGESGSGKSTLAASLLGLKPYSRGQIHFAKTLRTKDLQMVFQDPSSALNPRWLIADILNEALKFKDQAKLKHILDAVQMPWSCLQAYPHELSGGQRQRISIARALLAAPKLLICDEPTSALDISVQAQILNLLKDVQAQFDFTCIIITHDLDVVSYLADDVLILKDGRVMESGDFLEIWHNPKTDYTRQLFTSASP